MPIIDTAFGPIKALPSIESFDSGVVRSCIAADRSVLKTPYGELVPQHNATELRKRQLPALSFYENGMLRNLPLEEQIAVPTPIGPLPAEQVTFYSNGNLKRIFPLNGCLSGYWTQEDEAKLAQTLTLDTPLGTLEATIIAAYFGPQGELRSLTLWPGDDLMIQTPCGLLPVRIGVSFYDDGKLKSLEPGKPVSVMTPLGEILAFDPDAIGITGDSNSLRFDESGVVKGFSTVSHAFSIGKRGAPTRRVEPPIRFSPCDGQTPEAAPLHVSIEGKNVTFQADGMPTVTTPMSTITVSRFLQPMSLLGPDTCGLNSSFM